MALTFYTSVAKELKLKVRMFLGKLSQQTTVGNSKRLFQTYWITACHYVKENEELKKHIIVIVTKVSDHSRMATYSLILKVNDEVKSQYLRFNDFEKLGMHLWSDICASQFRSGFVHHLAVLFPESYQVIQYYNERHHGKGPLNGIGGCVKNMVFHAALSKKVVIHSPEDFARYANSDIKGFLLLIMATLEITEDQILFKKHLTYSRCLR